MTPEAPLRAMREPRREQPHLLDYLRVLFRRKFVTSFVFLNVVLGAVAYLHMTVPVYEAHARLIIERRSADGALVGEPVDQGETQQDYQTHYQLLKSRNLARKTIDTLALWDHPDLNPSRRPSGIPVVEQGRARLNDLVRLVTQSQEETEPPPDELRAQDRIIGSFIAHLSVTPVQNSRLVDLAFQSADPELAATVVNGLASTYIADDTDSKASVTRQTSDWLTGQIEEQRQLVEAAEAALQRYRERTGALSVEGGESIVVQKLADLNAAVTKAKTDRLEREAVYRQVASVADQPAALPAIPAVLANAFVQQQRSELVNLLRTEAELGDRLGDRHPEMIKVRLAIDTVETKLRAAIQDVVQSLRRDYESALAQEESLMLALNQQKEEAQSMNRKAIDYAVLQRDVETSKAVYDSLLQQGRQASATEDRTISNVRIVDRAGEPDTPISPKRKQILLMAILGGLFLSVSAAFFVEYLDHRVKTPEEVEIHLRLTSLGSIPRLSRRSRRAFASNRMLTHAAASSFAEAFRGLRANVLFSSPEGSPCSIVVTSASAREGKTIVASNLAIGLAQAGHQVILLDADLRQPRLHDLFGLKLEPGLSNVLSGTAEPADVVQATQIPNLRAVTAGAYPPNPAELVGSHRFAELLAFFERQNDIVVIDTPPVMAVADAAILAHRTSGVLFVVAADTTNRHAAQSALEQLERANGRFLGAVLNRAELDRDRYRYASSYSRSGYSKSRSSASLH